MQSLLTTPTSSTIEERWSVLPLLLATLVLSASTAFVLFDFAFEEPFAVVEARDAYVQVVGTTVLVVLWLELAGLSAWATATNRLHRLSIVIVLVAAGGIGVLGTCQVRYIREIVGARGCDQCGTGMSLSEPK